MKKRIYTEAEVNADLNEVMGDYEIPPLTRYILIQLGKRGLLDAFYEVVLDAPDDFGGDPISFYIYAINECYRRISA